MEVKERPPIAVHEAWLPTEHLLHRPRHGGSQRTAVIIALVFFVTPVLLLAVGVRPAAFENRALVGFPSPTDGWSFLTELPTWAVDHLPLRDAAVRASDEISRGVFAEPSPFDAGAPLAPPVAGSIVPAPPPTRSAYPPTAGFPIVVEGDDGWLYFGYDFEGKCEPLRPLDEVMAGLQRLRTAVEASGREFILVVPPDKSTSVPQHLPDSYAGRGCSQAHGDDFWRHVTTAGDAIDLRPTLARLAHGGRPIYHRLDTHWTDLGALAMVRALAEAIHPGVTDQWVSKPELIGEYTADLPAMIGRTEIINAQRYSLAPDGELDRTRHRSNELRAAARFVSRPRPGMVTDRVAMITDSFSLPARRYLAASFSDLQVVYYATASTDLDAVIDVMANGEVVVFEVVERNLAAGMPSILDGAAIDRIAAQLAAKPAS